MKRERRKYHWSLNDRQKLYNKIIFANKEFIIRVNYNIHYILKIFQKKMLLVWSEIFWAAKKKPS